MNSETKSQETGASVAVHWRDYATKVLFPLRIWTRHAARYLASIPPYSGMLHEIVRHGVRSLAWIPASIVRVR